MRLPADPLASPSKGRVSHRNTLGRRCRPRIKRRALWLLAMPTWLTSPWPAAAIDVGVVFLTALFVGVGVVPLVRIGRWHAGDGAAALFQSVLVLLVLVVTAWPLRRLACNVTVGRLQGTRRLSRIWVACHKPGSQGKCASSFEPSDLVGTRAPVWRSGIFVELNDPAPCERRAMNLHLLGAGAIGALQCAVAWQLTGLPIPMPLTTMRLLWWAWHARYVERSLGAGPAPLTNAEHADVEQPARLRRGLLLDSGVHGWSWIVWSIDCGARMILVPQSSVLGVGPS